ncbi:hypothetical protein HMN09_00257700 [Mycena chlorophos]|uniref:Uncharacterized protein n=1 Tax=Mycena chlorophos TaxID=658473 RepID=A0A8H6WNX7_MYCCL|nr:hypothetical protein HMN09_00257700 [Mycena chlorophos]
MQGGSGIPVPAFFPPVRPNLASLPINAQLDDYAGLSQALRAGLQTWLWELQVQAHAAPLNQTLDNSLPWTFPFHTTPHPLQIVAITPAGHHFLCVGQLEFDWASDSRELTWIIRFYNRIFARFIVSRSLTVDHPSHDPGVSINGALVLSALRRSVAAGRRTVVLASAVALYPAGVDPADANAPLSSTVEQSLFFEDFWLRIPELRSRNERARFERFLGRIPLRV